MGILRRASEELARKTSRRGFFGRGADIAFGALAGAAAGTLSRAGGVSAASTVCAFPYGRPCPCDGCQTSGVCAKPCIILTQFYAAGCWTTGPVTCCDCRCSDFDTLDGWCGCGSDYHNNPANCP
jgi:hypothetical protein